MVEIEQTKDTVVKYLTRTEGKELEITSNLTSPAQLNAALEGLVASRLGSDTGMEEYQMLLRLTISWKGRGREDLTSIGKAPEIAAWKMSNEHE